MISWQSDKITGYEPMESMSKVHKRTKKSLRKEARSTNLSKKNKKNKSLPRGKNSKAMNNKQRMLRLEEHLIRRTKQNKMLTRKTVALQ